MWPLAQHGSQVASAAVSELSAFIGAVERGQQGSNPVTWRMGELESLQPESVRPRFPLGSASMHFTLYPESCRQETTPFRGRPGQSQSPCSQGWRACWQAGEDKSTLPCIHRPCINRCMWGPTAHRAKLPLQLNTLPACCTILKTLGRHTAQPHKQPSRGTKNVVVD